MTSQVSGNAGCDSDRLCTEKLGVLQDPILLSLLLQVISSFLTSPLHCSPQSVLLPLNSAEVNLRISHNYNLMHFILVNESRGLAPFSNHLGKDTNAHKPYITVV